jgi:hypothetical protein
MVDEQEPAKRVVKRVVKKTVVRPAAPAEAKPQMRYGRPVVTPAKPRAKVASRKGGAPATAPAPTRTAPTSPVAKAPRTAPTRRPRPQVQLKARASAAGHRVADTWWTVADAVRAGGVTAGRFVGARARAVAAYRLPHINLYLASVITGAVVGLFAVLAGLVSLQVFESTRGVAGGGGLWGGLAFVVVAVLGHGLGALLLQGFGSRSARLTSFLGVVLAIVAILGLFLGLADSVAALVLLPLLGVVTYTIAHWLIDLAENTPAIIE